MCLFFRLCARATEDFDGTKLNYNSKCIICLPADFIHRPHTHTAEAVLGCMHLGLCDALSTLCIHDYSDGCCATCCLLLFFFFTFVEMIAPALASVSGVYSKELNYPCMGLTDS